MQLSEQTIQELREILHEDYGRKITLAETTEIARTLVGYFDLLQKIHHRELRSLESNDSPLLK